MSYDIEYRAKIEGYDELVKIRDSDANITYNVRELILKSSGWNIKNEDYNGTLINLIPLIMKGKVELLINKDKYKKYESPNGYGTIDGVIRFYDIIINDYYEIIKEYPQLDGFIHVYVC